MAEITYLTTIAPNKKYYVCSSVGNSADTVTYNSVVYSVGSTILGISGVSTFTFTGSGTVIDYISLLESTTEVVFNQEDIQYPEKLVLYEMSTELMQNQNGTVYPEQLTLYNLSTEVILPTELPLARIIYSKG